MGQGRKKNGTGKGVDQGKEGAVVALLKLKLKGGNQIYPLNGYFYSQEAV